MNKRRIAYRFACTSVHLHSQARSWRVTIFAFATLYLYNFTTCTLPLFGKQKIYRMPRVVIFDASPLRSEWLAPPAPQFERKRVPRQLGNADRLLNHFLGLKDNVSQVKIQKPEPKKPKLKVSIKKVNRLNRQTLLETHRPCYNCNKWFSLRSPLLLECEGGADDGAERICVMCAREQDMVKCDLCHCMCESVNEEEDGTQTCRSCRL